jgi:apolipoprotein N-acyltransferase
MVVDPTGKRQSSTNLYTRTKFIADINILSDRTFYVKYGDVIAKICLTVSSMILITAVLKKNKSKRN